MPSIIAVPSVAFTPVIRTGVDEPDTTRGEPPLDGVLNAITSFPTLSDYNVFPVQEDA